MVSFTPVFYAVLFSYSPVFLTTILISKIYIELKLGEDYYYRLLLHKAKAKVVFHINPFNRYKSLLHIKFESESTFSLHPSSLGRGSAAAVAWLGHG